MSAFTNIRLTIVKLKQKQFIIKHHLNFTSYEKD